ncbi:hypothetical protein QJ48_20890 [Paenibacillus sp. A3]|nr:hypothetical protein QJ48_20890 [Paenibacillus sp. A3]
MMPPERKMIVENKTDAVAVRACKSPIRVNRNANGLPSNEKGKGRVHGIVLHTWITWKFQVRGKSLYETSRASN